MEGGGGSFIVNLPLPVLLKIYKIQVSWNIYSLNIKVFAKTNCLFYSYSMTTFSAIYFYPEEPFHCFCTYIRLKSLKIKESLKCDPCLISSYCWIICWAEKEPTKTIYNGTLSLAPMNFGLYVVYGLSLSLNA